MKRFFCSMALLTSFGSTLALQANCFDPVVCTQYDNGCDMGDVTAGIDWLYWKTGQSRMKFAQTERSSGTDIDAFIKEHILEPKFKYENGVRAYLGYRSIDQDWEIQLAYTYLPGKGSRTVSGLDAQTIVRPITSNFPLLAGGILSELQGKWSEKFNQVDLDLGRAISICDTIQIRPHLGLRGIWLDQHFSVDGTNNLGLEDSFLFKSQFKSQLWGIGLEGGLYGTCKLDWGFSLVGHVGGALLYSKIDDHQKVFNNSTGNLFSSSVKDHSQQATPMLDGFIGINYATCLYERDVSVYLGWEEHVIFDTNPFSLEGGSTLTMQGLTLGGSVSF